MRPTPLSPLGSILLLAVLASMGAGCHSGDSGGDAGLDGPRRTSGTALTSISFTYPFSMDASVPTTTVTVDASGAASCSGTSSAGLLSRGELPADPAISELLSRPGLVDDLGTWCSLGHTEGGPYLATQFAGDDAVFWRLVEYTCANDNLDALVQAMMRIGDACLAAATQHFNPPDGGNHLPASGHDA